MRICTAVLGAMGITLGLLPGSSPAGAELPRGPAAVLRVGLSPVIPRFARALGSAPASKRISGDVALVPRHAGLLSSYAASVSKPGSPYYGHYLSLASVLDEFAPSAATVRAVERYLEAGGLTVTTVSANRLLVGWSGTAGAAQSAFHTALESYRLRTGRHVFANTSPIEMASTVASGVRAVIGLNNLVVPEPAATGAAEAGAGAGSPVAQAPAGGAPRTAGAAPRAAGRAPSAASAAPAGAASPCAAASKIAARDDGLTADKVAYSYGLDPLYAAGDSGSGQSIDILDLFGFAPSDVATFDDCYFGAAEGATIAAADAYTSVDGGAVPGSGAGGSIETELDVEAVNAYAPKATVDVYEAPDTNYGFLDAIAAMTESNARLESISYGTCEAELQLLEPGYVETESYLFEEAAAMGKTVFASSGDNGSDTCSDNSGGSIPPPLSASDPASQPYVTGVGGTAITSATDPPEEKVWNDGKNGDAGGGGISAIWPEPAWQATSKVPGINDTDVEIAATHLDGDGFCLDYYSGVNCREVPDVSAEASPEEGGFPVFAGGGWAVYGGTSLSSPTWAAILADINSTPSCEAGGGAGFISPKLYAIASVPAEYAASFNDVTTGDNDNFGTAAGLFPATRGYDMATGLGSPRVTGPGGTHGLAYYLCAAPATAAPTVTGLSPAALSSSAITGRRAHLEISGTGFERGGVPEVAAVSIGNVAVRFAVTGATSIDVTAPPRLLALETGNGGAFNGSGTYDVEVTLVGGATSTPGPRSTLVLYDTGGGTAGTMPVVDGVSPAAGPAAGGSTVTIYGSGFTKATSVTFGGLPAKGFAVTSDDTITAVTPPEPPGSACVKGDDEVTGVCQTEVQVTLSDGTASAERAIPKEFSGVIADSLTVAGEYPAATEFDFEPPPTITGISLDAGATLASEVGGTKATIRGTGLGYLGFEWADVGSYLDSGSIDGAVISASSTSVTLLLNGTAKPTSSPENVPIWVQTYGSANNLSGLSGAAPSNSVEVAYAPTPKIESLHVSGRSHVAGPTGGGATLTIEGSGFQDSYVVTFLDLEYGFPVDDYGFDSTAERITLSTLPLQAGLYLVAVCGVSGCSAPSRQTYTSYPPGNPVLTSSTPRSGRAGTTVTISGRNLGFVEAVFFGDRKASFAQASYFVSGGARHLKAKAPPGSPGSSVAIRVVTLESLATGYGKSHASRNATFTYAGGRRRA